jgi:hypothetical protein
MKLGALFLLLVVVPLWPAGAAGIDLHDYWDQRCQSCHGHSSEFARRFLRVENGRLLGAHHRTDLDVFLRHHYLSDDLIAPVSAMLMAQVTTPPLFRDLCSRCHGSAAEFARKSLTLRDGVLVGRASGRRVADYLASHGELAPADVPIVADSLARVRQEVSSTGR